MSLICLLRRLARRVKGLESVSRGFFFHESERERSTAPEVALCVEKDPSAFRVDAAARPQQSVRRCISDSGEQVESCVLVILVAALAIFALESVFVDLVPKFWWYAE